MLGGVASWNSTLTENLSVRAYDVVEDAKCTLLSLLTSSKIINLITVFIR